jgi:hypothetical protein
MDIQARIDRLLQNLQRSGRATPTLILYAEGVKAKLRQARFSLKMLRDLVHLEDEHSGQGGATGPTVLDSLTISEQVNYYCDCFWDFLRSALDILGQLINELQPLGITERDVDFKKVVSKMKTVAPGSPLEKALDALRNHNRAFKQLEDYRHCSTHRRHIYIETKTVTEAVTGSPGYYAGGSASRRVTERYLCTNPWDVRPRVNRGKRPVVEYCESLLTQIEENINKIVYHLP